MAGKQEFNVCELKDSFVIPCAKLGPDEVYVVSKELLPSRSLEEHAKQARNAASDEYHASTAPEIYDISSVLFSHKDCPGVKDVQVFLRRLFTNFVLSTLSRVEWNPRGKDTVIHRYGQNAHYSVRQNLVGPDGFIVDKSVRAKGLVQAVFDTSNGVKQVDDIFYWLTEKHVYEFRCNDKPEQKYVRVVALGVVNDDYFYIDANDLINDCRPALGVRRAKISEQTQRKIAAPSMEDILALHNACMADFEKKFKALYHC